MITRCIIRGISVFVMVISFNANAAVINTLNGVEYAWLELTSTVGSSRADIELRLNDPNDSLYGYQYANAEQIESLFLSYAAWDGLDGVHTSGAVTSGIRNFIYDFGYTWVSVTSMDNPYYATSVGEGDFVLDNAPFTDQTGASGHYGQPEDCNGGTCIASMSFIYSPLWGSAGVQYGSSGWGVSSGSDPNYRLAPNLDCTNCAHFLITTDMSLVTVPIPAAIWLFGSGLVCLLGLSRRKKTLN